MARRSDHSREEIREMALAAAEQIIEQEGGRGLSARKVANAIGYTVGTLYLVFDKLDDLILQVNGRTLDRLHAALAKARDEAGTPRQRLLQLGQAYLGFARRDPHRWRLVFEHHPAAGTERPAWLQEKAERTFRLVETELRHLAPGQPPAAIALAARALWSGVHGVCILAMDNRLDGADDDPAQALTRSLMDNYLAGFTHGAGKA